MTPRYRAPEIQRDVQYLAEGADIFGVGVCLYMIMFQAVPFEGKFCLYSKHYKKHFLEKEEADLSFFDDQELDLGSAPSDEPFEAILRCFHPDPALRPTLEEL